MLDMLGRGEGRYCDGLSRRSFLKAGTLGLGGMALPQLLRAEEKAGLGSSNKSVILVYLAGGIAHQDTFDLKPNAPAEIRGEFKPIASKVPGFDVCEHLPRLASIADKYAVIRSIVGMRDEHSSFHTATGYPMDVAQREHRPHFGSVISRLQGPRDPVVPPFIDLFPVMQHKPYNSPGPGYLGVSHSPSRMSGDDLALLQQTSIAPARFGDRKGLLSNLDAFRRSVDTSATQGMDRFYERAFSVLASDKVARALDVEREDPRLRDRYGKGVSTPLGDAAPMWNDQLLIARRLVEAGARCVTVAYGFWDTHGDNFNLMKKHLPLFDQGISALIEDIHARGLQDDVTVLVMGEFGRTPKINKDAGRDHWAPVNSVLLAGGGMKTGQVIGATDAMGAYAAAQPIHYQDILATVYHNLGIDPNGFVNDKSDRPISILPSTAQPIAKLV
ncbi:DUF1501 domain-containing protein [Isosphaeraceae bacterium EP7]